MSALDSSIDDLYQQPLNDFTQARNALAKSLGGADAKRVKALAKPTLVPWAVNQVYWRARGTYDRLMKSGERLRAAQIAALEGRDADVRAATETHRRAIADAVREAERLGATAGSKPSPDALARTFEALSVATGAPEPPGRLTQPLQPAGFEALAGVTPLADAGRVRVEADRTQRPPARRRIAARAMVPIPIRRSAEHAPPPSPNMLPIRNASGKRPARVPPRRSERSSNRKNARPATPR